MPLRLGQQAKARSYTYRRSDGSPWTLTMADLLGRIEAFEVSWNPNDCVEVRWAAPEGSEERATCQGRAPKAQLRKIAEYRQWFDARERPLR